jgi:hypothetical protein
MRALLAAMERRVAFRTMGVESGSRRQSRRAVVTTRRSNRLDQSRETRSGDIERGFGALVIWFEWPVPMTIATAIAVGVVIAVLTILAIAIHGV